MVIYLYLQSNPTIENIRSQWPKISLVVEKAAAHSESLRVSGEL